MTLLLAAVQWAAICGAHMDPTETRIEILARPYRIYRDLPVFLGPCQKAPGTWAQSFTVSDQTCGTRPDSSGAAVIQETRSFYTDDQGNPHLVRPCSPPKRNPERLPVSFSTLHCPLSLDLHAMIAWPWRQRVYSKSGHLHKLGPCSDDRALSVPLREVSCADVEISHEGRLFRLAASRFVLGDEKATEIVACAPHPGKAVAKRREGCSLYFVHHSEIAESFGAVRFILADTGGAYLIDTVARKLVPAADAVEGQGCMADIEQSVAQIEILSGWRHDDRLGLSWPLLDIVAANAEYPLVRRETGEPIFHHYIHGGTIPDAAVSTAACATVHHRFAEWRAFRPDGSSYSTLGPAIEADVDLKSCQVAKSG